MLWIIPENGQAAVVMKAKSGLKQPLLEFNLTLNPIIKVSNYRHSASHSLRMKITKPCLFPVHG